MTTEYESIHVDMAQQRCTAELIGNTDGPIAVTSGKPCYDHNAINSATIVDMISEGRLLATANGKSPKIYCKWRADLFAPASSIAVPAGFREEWLLSITDLREARRDALEWARAGYAFRFLKEGRYEWDRYVHTGAPKQMYHAGQRGRNVDVYAMVCDLTNPHYRAWAVASAVRYCRLYSLDGIIMSAKMGWHSYGSPTRSTPDNDKGGVLYTSPHGPGEFEGGFAALLAELYAEGIRPILITRPGLPGEGKWDWMDAITAELPLGEYI